jgi:hypothetical protein
MVNGICQYHYEFCMIAPMRISAFTPLILVAAAVGCASTKATFEVQVKNESDTPISAGFVKEAPRQVILASGRPAVEEGWAAPEDIAINAPQFTSRHWGTVIAPGKSAVLGPLTGDFPLGLLASLRVYAGDHTVDELLAFSRSDPDRVDIDVLPGQSAYVIVRKQGKLAAAPVDAGGPR